jgi:hypothetical protein
LLAGLFDVLQLIQLVFKKPPGWVGQEEMFMCTYLLFLSSVENTVKEGGKCDAEGGKAAFAFAFEEEIWRLSLSRLSLSHQGADRV